MTPPPRDPSSYLDQGSGVYLRSQLDAMRNGVYATLVSPEGAQAWDSDQLGLQRQINDLAQQLGVDVDPVSIAGGDFTGMPLEQIRNLVYEIKPDVVHAVSEAWGKIGSGLGDATRALDDGLKKAIVGGWEGFAAKTAADSLGTFVQTSTDIGNSASLVGMKVAYAQRGSDETLRMLGPVLERVVPVTGALVQPGGLPTLSPDTAVPTTTPQIPVLAIQQATDADKKEACEAAVQVLQNVYAPGIQDGGQGVPVLPSVQPVANPNGPVGPSSPGPVSLGPDSSNPGGGDQNPASGDANPAADPNTDPNTSRDDSRSPGAQPTSDTSGTSQNLSGVPVSGVPNAASTTAAGFDSGSGLGGGTSGSGVGGGSHGSGLGGPSGVGGGTPRPGMGSAIPGGMAAARQGVPLGMCSPVQAGTPGMPGMSPGMGGKGGKSEEDKERRSADYLRGDHLEEWIEDGRKVMPAYGAIGENPSPEQQPANRPPVSRPASPPDRGRAPGEYR